MELMQIVSQLKKERDYLDRAITALETVIGRNPAARTQQKTRFSSKITPINSTKRRLSAAARRRISQAQKRRWAELRKAS